MQEFCENRLLSVCWELTFFPFIVFLRDFWCFPGPVSFIPCLPHSPTPQGSISSDPETRCPCCRIRLDMVTSSLSLTGYYDYIILKPKWLLCLPDTWFHYSASFLVIGILLTVPWKISITWAPLSPSAVLLISGSRMNHLKISTALSRAPFKLSSEEMHYSISSVLSSAQKHLGEGVTLL